MPSGRPPVQDRHVIAHIAGAGRAGAVVRGLLRTGRARPRRLCDTADDAAEFIVLERREAHGGRYWVARDGSEIRAGVSFAEAEPLQQGFADAMARAGAAP